MLRKALVIGALIVVYGVVVAKGPHDYGLGAVPSVAPHTPSPTPVAETYTEPSYSPTPTPVYTTPTPRVTPVVTTPANDPNSCLMGNYAPGQKPSWCG